MTPRQHRSQASFLTGEINHLRDLTVLSRKAGYDAIADIYEGQWKTKMADFDLHLDAWQNSKKVLG